MKPLLVLALLLAALVLPGRAPAKATWPASCHSWDCVNRHLNALHAQVHYWSDRISVIDQQIETQEEDNSTARWCTSEALVEATLAGVPTGIAPSVVAYPLVVDCGAMWWLRIWGPL